MYALLLHTLHLKNFESPDSNDERKKKGKITLNKKKIVIVNEKRETILYRGIWPGNVN